MRRRFRFRRHGSARLSLALSLIAVFGTKPASAQAPRPADALQPEIQRIVGEISQARIEANLKKLESFGTRYDVSDSDETSGILATEHWLHDEFHSYSPRLKVTGQSFRVKKGTRNNQVFREIELTNVVAMLPGFVDPNRFVLVTAHYDTVNIQRHHKMTEAERIADLVKKGMDQNEAQGVVQLFPTAEALGNLDPESTGAQKTAPGVTDDASGTAAILELARVLSQHKFAKTLVFVAFAGEEIGLEGSKSFAVEAKTNRMQIEAVLNNDIIGSDVAGNGASANSTLRMFADGPEDSPARALLRYSKLMAERYVPSMRVEMVFHADRFNRGGDHTSFTTQGFAAIRLTSPNENFENQHTATDTFANTSVPYTTRVTRMNAAVLASLALAPPPPVVNYTFQSGERQGDRSPLLGRGTSGYDAALRWQAGEDDKTVGYDVAGYAIVMRSTTAPDWEREIWVGNVTSFTIPDISIDDTVFGVKAIDRDGNQSMVAAYLEPLIHSITAPPAAPSENTKSEK